jgi:hypothetical protein
MNMITKCAAERRNHVPMQIYRSGGQSVSLDVRFCKKRAVHEMSL